MTPPRPPSLKHRLRRWWRGKLLRLAGYGGLAACRYDVAATAYGPMIVNRNDLVIGRSLRRAGAFDPDDVEALATLVERRLRRQPRVVLVDAGANVGVHALAIAGRFGGRVIVHAVEAQAEMFRLLAANVALNAGKSVHSHHRAVSDADGEILTFHAPDYDAENSFGSLELLPPVWSDNGGLVRGAPEQVVTVAIDTLAADADILKLDIEGMELRALNGARSTIEKKRPYVLCEMLKSDKEAIRRFFADRGYRGETHGQSMAFLPEEELP